MEAKLLIMPRTSNGFYLECGRHIVRCTYQPTHGFEGFGKAKRRVTYPAGSIRVPFGKVKRDCPSLDDAKQWLAGMVETESDQPREGLTRVHGHSGLQGIAHDMRLYIMPCGDGFSCYGFDVAERKRRAVAEWCGFDMPAAELGTVAHFDAFQAAIAAGAAHHKKTGARCPAELDSRLIGLEGKRIEVTAPDGDKRRFWVGRSSGWMPCHLEIERRGDSGGGAVYLPEGASIRVI